MSSRPLWSFTWSLSRPRVRGDTGGTVCTLELIEPTERGTAEGQTTGSPVPFLSDGPGRGGLGHSPSLKFGTIRSLLLGWGTSVQWRLRFWNDYPSRRCRDLSRCGIIVMWSYFVILNYFLFLPFFTLFMTSYLLDGVNLRNVTVPLSLS